MKKQFRKCLAILMALTFMLASASFSAPADHYAYAETENAEPSIEIDNKTLGVLKGDNVTLIATLKDFQSNPEVTWESSDSDIVSVGTETGSAITIRAEKKGTAIITASATENERVYTAECKVTVYETGIPRIELDKVSPKDWLLNIGDTEKVTATIHNADSNDVIWSSSNKNVATVDENGNVTAVRAGSARIKATIKVNNIEYTGECFVGVLGVTASERELYMTVGDNKTLVASLDNLNGSPTVSWESSDSVVVSVSPETGSQITITANAVGLAKITVVVAQEGKEYTDTCEVAVFEHGTPNISLDKPTLTLTEDDTEKLTPRSDNIPLNDVVWSSSNEKAATVDQNGNVTAVAAGTATITATAKVIKREYAATCEVTVNAAESEPPEPPEPPEPSVEPDATPAASGIILGKMTASGSNNMAISWTRINGVAGYDVFMAKCGGSDQYKLVKDINGDLVNWTATGLKAKTAYKVIIKAYVMDNGTKSYEKTSPTLHAYTSGGSKYYTNPKSVKVKKAKATIKVGKTFKIRGSVKKLKKGKKLISKGHAPRLRYLSSDTNIATVSSNGKIKAIAKGSCTIYVYAANGVMKTVNVTVK